MTLDIDTARKLKPRRNRKLPRRQILDTDFVAPSSHRVIDDLLLEQAPSQHDRIILSELWGGNSDDFSQSRMPPVSIGKPKRFLHGDNTTKPKTYKDMLKENHKDEWKMDLSHLTFVPPSAKGKHIRPPNENTLPIEQVSEESVSEIDTNSLSLSDSNDKENRVADSKQQDTETITANTISQTDCSDAEDHNEFEKSKPSSESKSTDMDDTKQTLNVIEKDKSKNLRNTSQEIPMLHNIVNVDEANHDIQPERDQTSICGSSGESVMDKDNTRVDMDDSDPQEYADEDECMVDYGAVEKLQQLPIAVDQISEQENGLNDSLNKAEIPPPTNDKSSAKENAIWDKPLTEIGPSIDQMLVPEACMAENNVGDEDDRHLTKLEHLKFESANSTSSAQMSSSSSTTSTSLEEEEEKDNSIPPKETATPSVNVKCSDQDQGIMDAQQQDQQSSLPFEAPESRQMLTPKTPLRRVDKASKKQVLDEKPLLKLNPTNDEAEAGPTPHSKILKRWQQNRKTHRLLDALKQTTAVDWIEDGSDDTRKKTIGSFRKRQLQAKFDQPFVIKKRIKSCWFIEEK